MKTLPLILFALSLSAADWKVTVTPLLTQDTAPSMLRQYISPGAKPGWSVVSSSVPDDAKSADAFQVTLRVEDAEKKMWTRVQIVPRRTDGNGNLIVGDVFVIGFPSKIVSVTMAPVRWENKAEAISETSDLAR